MARSLRSHSQINLHLCLSKQSEFFGQTADLGLPTLGIDTYSGAISAALATPRLPFALRQISNYIKEHRIDVALCTMAHLWNPLVMRAIRLQRIPSLIVIHDALAHAGENWGVRNLMIRSDVRQADGIITLTAAVQDRLIGHYNYPRESTWVIPLGAFTYGSSEGLSPQPRQLPQDRPPRILFFGRILPYKGLHLLTAATELLRSRGYKLDVRVSGQGSLGSLRLPEGTEVVNRWIPEEDILSQFSEVDAVVLPYTEASQSGVLAISNSLGIPAVVTPIGGLPEQIDPDRSGIVAGAVNAEAISQAIEALLFAGPEFYRSASVASLEFAKRSSSWKTISDAVCSILSDVAKQRDGMARHSDRTEGETRDCT